MSPRLTGFLALLGVVACGSPPPTATPSDESASADAAIDPHVHGVVPSASLTHGLHSGLAPNTAGILKDQGPKVSSYDASAPATVLITTPWGHGSGVLVDSRGHVLTNYHVVAAGETADLSIETEVTLADLAEDGSARPGERYRAKALKIDVKRDLALLQLIDAPDDLPVAPIATRDPRPGRRVVAMGHAGVGFGWAVKHCSINAIGTLESRAAAMVSLQSERYTEEQRKELERVVAAASRNAGRQIQSDCAVLPGDSGGPLIDEETHELVGLNVAISTATNEMTSLGSVAFHIHVAELRDFLKDVPAEPTPFVPDPWETGGFEAALDDTDGNGEYDTFRLAGPCGPGFLCHALFVDMQQQSFARGTKTPPLADIHENRLFKSDFVVLMRARPARTAPQGLTTMVPVVDTLFFYDGNHDGTLDGLLVVDGETNATRAFTRNGSTYRRDEGRDGVEISPELFTDPAKRERFAAYRHTINTGMRDASSARRTAAVELKVSDLTGDGIPETVYAETRTDERTLVDLDQTALTELEGDALHEALDAGSIGFDFVAVSSAPVRVWYDTNNDGHLDLLLEAASWESQFAAVATRYATDGTSSRAPEHVGRRLLRPGLVGAPELAERLGTVLERTRPNRSADVDDGRSSLPPPLPDPRAHFVEVDKSKGRALAAVDNRMSVMLDLDGDTLKGRNAPADVVEAARAGRFDAEFVFTFDGVLAWAFYDRNGDGSFDAVYVARGDDPMKALVRYEIAKDGTVTADTSVEGQKMWESNRFTRAPLRRTFDNLAPLVLANP
jgi:S1-C subfamily serine protease